MPERDANQLAADVRAAAENATPGPWTVGTAEDWRDGAKVGGCFIVCPAVGAPIVRLDARPGVPAERQEADAILIAAAPELVALVGTLQQERDSEADLARFAMRERCDALDRAEAAEAALLVTTEERDAADSQVAHWKRLHGAAEVALAEANEKLRAIGLAVVDAALAAADGDTKESDDLRHWTRRMLQALDGYWLHYDGWNGDPKRYPRSRSDQEDWWNRFEKYRARVQALLSPRA